MSRTAIHLSPVERTTGPWRVWYGELAGLQAIAAPIAQGDPLRSHRPQVTTVAVECLRLLLDDRLRVLVDRVGPGRGVHPAEPRVEALVDEELSPGDRAVGSEPAVAGHLQLGAEVE